MINNCCLLAGDLKQFKSKEINKRHLRTSEYLNGLSPEFCSY